MSMPRFLRPAAVVVWVLSFAAIWLVSGTADADTFWLAPAFFLPQFILVAGLVSGSARAPWPWGPFLAAALPATSVISLCTLFLTGSILEAHDARMETLPPAMVVIPLAAGAACFAWYLSLRHRPRRRAALSLLASICAGAVLLFIVAAASLPAAERQDVFLAGLLCRVSIALALIVLAWTIPGWIAAGTLPATLDLPVSAPPGVVKATPPKD